jgi:GDP-D-mannose dehydratase
MDVVDHRLHNLLFVWGHLSERGAVEALIDRVSPEAVVHLAAQSSAGKSFSEPFDTLTRNVWPALNLLDQAERLYGEADRTFRGELAPDEPV